MAWTRNASASEKLMVDVLRNANKVLTLDEIVKQISHRNPTALSGKTPNKSLYSVVYRRENRRKERGLLVLFKNIIRGGARYYSISLKGLESISERKEEK